jgi:hypothetical protein
MPINPYLKHGAVFTPEALAVMGKAFEGAVAALGIDHNESKRETVAQLIIELALSPKDLDATALRDQAIAALGARNTSAGEPSRQ